MKDPATIGSYDWSDYIVQKLIDGAVKIKPDLRLNNKVPNITGCAIFLLVLYLDSIDLGVRMMQHNLFPRIQAFNLEKIKSMILADSMVTSEGSQNVVFGKNRLRSRQGVCYRWASEDSGSSNDQPMINFMALWNATSLLARVLRVPMEVAALELSYCRHLKGYFSILVHS
ncbi:hypothetical protein C2845_PM03G31270 [Panicum miliaceum]|uniref:Uncharacterized protein n=1 Tax=Panicum miliaceum TaxID=4540 RepID=A0A3L6TD20_PANMI|nr:hypothetical protein C2845_PM03G31270 [Panicum miliaceum]